MLPRIPTPETRERFEQLADGGPQPGRPARGLRVGGAVSPRRAAQAQARIRDDRETWRVSKMKWAR